MVACRLQQRHAYCAPGTVLSFRHACPGAALSAPFPGEDTQPRQAALFTVVLGQGMGWTPISMPPAARGPLHLPLPSRGQWPWWLTSRWACI